MNQVELSPVDDAERPGDVPGERRSMVPHECYASAASPANDAPAVLPVAAGAIVSAAPFGAEARS